MKTYIPLDWLREQSGKALSPEQQTAFETLLSEAPAVQLPEDGILSVRSCLVRYDSAETYPDCTVQILRSSDTGECSVGWWRNDSPPVSL